MTIGGLSDELRMTAKRRLRLLKTWTQVPRVPLSGLAWRHAAGKVWASHCMLRAAAHTVACFQQSHCLLICTASMSICNLAKFVGLLLGYSKLGCVCFASSRSLSLAAGAIRSLGRCPVSQHWCQHCLSTSSARSPASAACPQVLASNGCSRSSGHGRRAGAACMGVRAIQQGWVRSAFGASDDILEPRLSSDHFGLLGRWAVASPTFSLLHNSARTLRIFRKLPAAEFRCHLAPLAARRFGTLCACLW